MIKKLLFYVVLFLLPFMVLSQSLGDYKSNVTTGNWTTLSNWQYYNGTEWVTPSGTSPQGYPGQFTGTGAVLIQTGDVINIGTSGITTETMGTLTISGSLVLTAIGTGSLSTDFKINTPLVIVTPSIGTIVFKNKVNFRLPKNATLQVNSGGLTGDCSAQQSIYIDTLEYAVCNGNTADTGLTFENVMNGGGTLNAIASSNSPVCNGENVSLIGIYSGVTGNKTSGGTSGVNYSWSIKAPDNSITTSPSFIANQTGNYLATLTCSTYYGSDLVTNSETISVLVNAKPTASLTSNDADNIFCAGTSVTFTATGGTNYTFKVAGSSVQNGATATYTTTTLTNGQIVTVDVTNASGCITTSTGITNTVNALPVITIQPVSQLDCEGSFVNFKVVASGSGLSYVWQYKRPTDTSFVTIPVGETNTSFPTSNEISLANVGSAQYPNGTQFQVVVSNGTCSVTSNAVVISVNLISNITGGTKITQCYGTNYFYKVVTNYPANVVSYQWKKSVTSGVWTVVNNGGAYSGANTDTLTITGGTPAETAEYRVYITFTNSTTQCSVDSSSRTRLITFLPLLTIPQLTVSQPDCTINTGTITVTVQSTTDSYSFDNGLNYQSGNVKSGLAPGTYKVIIKNIKNCVSAVVNCIVTAPITAIWDGTSWTNGPPTSAQALVFNGTYSSFGNLEACSCQVNSGTVTINSGHTLKITNEVTAQSTGALTFESGSSLVQINDTPSIPNSGNIIYKRDTTRISNLDYTYWSSPVALQSLYNVSPGTSGDKFYSFDSGINNWKQENSGNTMSIGTGYIIRGPQNFASPKPPGLYTASFIGVPNNGVKYTPIGVAGNFNLIGNPYPSALDADSFITANAGIIDGTIYFWTHNTDIGIGVSNPGSGLYAYSSDDYAAYNLTGGVATRPATSVGSNSNAPSGKIASGQAFFTTSIATGNAVFNNSMRVGVGGILGDNSQFFKNASNTKAVTAIEKDRLWLNLFNEQGAFKQTLVGYITGATNEFDKAYDGESFNSNAFLDFYSIYQDKNLVIQGRALPLDEADEVPLGYSSTIVGDFEIAIGQVEGSLVDSDVFLEDKLLNVTQNLKEKPYSFATEKGVFNDRFMIRYTNKTLATDTNKTLATDNFVPLEKGVLISNKNKEIKIKSSEESINKVFIYDFSGKQLFEKTNVGSNEYNVLNLISSDQALIVKVILHNGQIVNKKFIF